MTDPKRCEVCGLLPCNLWMTGCEGHCHCNGHSSPPPRPNDSEKVCEFDPESSLGFCVTHGTNCGVLRPTPKEVPPRTEEWGRFKNKYGLGSLYTKQEAYLPNPYKEVYAEVMKDVEALLLSYGKEREKEIFRKCREAVRCHDISAYVGSEVVDLHNDIISALDALNPDHSSHDEGREGNV